MTQEFKGFLLLLAASVAFGAGAQAPDPAALIATQREAMKAFADMDGVWRGPAWSLQPNGEKRNLTQTERIGPFLDGSVKVIEGRGYKEDATVGFNALGVVSHDPAKKAFTIRSWAMGRGGEFAFTPLPDGYAWEIPAGPGAGQIPRDDQGRHAYRGGRPPHGGWRGPSHLRDAPEARGRQRLARG